MKLIKGSGRGEGGSVGRTRSVIKFERCADRGAVPKMTNSSMLFLKVVELTGRKRIFIFSSHDLARIDPRNIRAYFHAVSIILRS